MSSNKINANIKVTIINNVNDFNDHKSKINSEVKSPSSKTSAKPECRTRYNISTKCICRLFINFRQRLNMIAILWADQLPLPDLKICDSREPCRPKDCSDCREIKNNNKTRPKRKFGILEKFTFTAILLVDMFSLGDGLKWAWNPVSRHNKKSWNSEKMPCAIKLQTAEHKRRQFLDGYILLTTAVIIATIFVLWDLVATRGNFVENYRWLAWVALLSAQQIVEMMASTARMVFIDVYDAGQKPASSNRLVLMLFLGYLKMLFAFSLIYLWFKSRSGYTIELNPLELSASVQLSLDTHFDDTSNAFLEAVIALQALLTISMIALFFARMLNFPYGTWGKQSSPK